MQGEAWTESTPVDFLHGWEWRWGSSHLPSAALLALPHRTPSVAGLQLSLGDPGWAWQLPECRHGYTSKKKNKKFPCILHFPCKVNTNQMGENIFFIVTPPGQPNIIYALYGEHWREGWRGFGWKALSGTAQPCWVGARGLVHTELWGWVCEQGVRAAQPSCPAQDVCVARTGSGNAIGMYKIISDDTCFEKKANREELARSKSCIVWSFSSFMVE